MSTFIAVFLPEVKKSGKLGLAISILESFGFRAVRPQEFQVHKFILEKKDEYQRVVKFWKDLYSEEEVKEKTETLLQLCANGTSIVAIAFEYDCQLYEPENDDVSFVVSKLKSQKYLTPD